MTARELIDLLNDYALDLEVWTKVRGQEAKVTDVDMITGGAETWLLITDYPVDPK